MKYVIATVLISAVVSSLSLHSLYADEAAYRFAHQAELREERSFQIHAGIYPKLTSFGAVYNFNRYLSLGAFYHKDNNLQFDMLYSTRDWMMHSVYFQGGDTYIYGASRARLDWSGPQVFVNPRVFPLPDIPVYFSATAGKDIYGDIGKHNLLIAYNASQMKWILNPPVYMEQEGSPYWFATAGIGAVIHLPYGFFIDAHYTEGKYKDYYRKLHARNDERIFITRGLVLKDGFATEESGAGLMTAEEFILSFYLMNARHRERGHEGRHVIYDITAGWSFAL